MYDALPASVQAVIARLEQELGEPDASIQAILKGHLLVEEMLTAILEGFVREPVALRRARLTFAQRCNLVRSLCSRPSRGHDAERWTLIEKLNELRNALSHSLDRARLEQKAREFLAHYRQHEREPQVIADYEKAEPADRLMFGVGACLGFLASVADEFRGQHPPWNRPEGNDA